MLQVRPKSLAARAWEVRDDEGALVAELQSTLLSEGATVQLDGKVLRIAREGLTTGPWKLTDGDEVLYEASKPSADTRRFEVNVRGAWLDLSPEGSSTRRFSLVGPDWAQLGSVSKSGLLSRKVEVDLDDRVPVEAKLLLLFCALLAWSGGADGSTTS